MIDTAFAYLVFPGLLFLVAAGFLVSWIDRKVSARLQWRVGPPFFQPFYDIRKLFVKEVVVPRDGNPLVFVLAPMIALLAALFISTLLFRTRMTPGQSFGGDIIVLLYLFTVPPLAGILGASASNSPYASLGASREMKAILSYELPFVMTMLVPVIKSGSLSLGRIVESQAAGSFAASPSGLVALLVAVLCLQAKLCLVPFDVSEAETEIAAGTQVEYSGPLLALWKLSKMMLLVIGPAFAVVVFWSGGPVWTLIPKYFALFAAAVLIKNTNPRLRIDQTVRFFWTTVTAAAFVAVMLAAIGL